MTERERWRIVAPGEGKLPPWPLVAEFADHVPSSNWTLIGGVMVQIHALRSSLQIVRPTDDVDAIVHLETGVTTYNGIRASLEDLGYHLQVPFGSGGVHMFLRGPNRIDLMVADHLAPKWLPRALGRPVFQVPGGTSALRKTVDVEVDVPGRDPFTLSVPDALGALVLKGAAYLGDARDRARHLSDAAVIAVGITDPHALLPSLGGSDRSRIRRLRDALPPDSEWWQLFPDLRPRGLRALEVLAGGQPPQKDRPRTS